MHSEEETAIMKVVSGDEESDNFRSADLKIKRLMRGKPLWKLLVGIQK